MLLMIDNYDSFTYNLVQYFGELGEEVMVFRNDEITLDKIAQMNPAHIVISPGPCTPSEAGVSVPLIERFAGARGLVTGEAGPEQPRSGCVPGPPDERGAVAPRWREARLPPLPPQMASPTPCRGGIPILGVCLGHQSIGQAFGGRIVHAQQLMHGKTSQIFHNRSGVFAGLPSPFTATRYHSLVIERASLPDCLEITAWTEGGEAGEEDGEIMGVRHKTLAVEGVQFHPESILTEHGHKLLKNFLRNKQ